MLNQWSMSHSAFGNAGHATGSLFLRPYIHQFSAPSALIRGQLISWTI